MYMITVWEIYTLSILLQIQITVLQMKHPVLWNRHVISCQSFIIAGAGQDYLPGGRLDVHGFATACECAFQSQEEVALRTTIRLLLKESYIKKSLQLAYLKLPLLDRGKQQSPSAQTSKIILPGLVLRRSLSSS